MARTRTLTLGGFVLRYSLCIPWSVGVGLLSLRLSRLMPTDRVAEGAAANGPSIGIAIIASPTPSCTSTTSSSVLCRTISRRWSPTVELAGRGLQS